MTRPARWPRAVLWLLIAALHLLLLALLTPSVPSPQRPQRTSVELQLLPAPRAREARREMSPVAQDTSRTVRRAARATRAMAPPAPAHSEAMPAPAPEPEPAPAAIVEAPIAAPAPAPSLLHSEGTRRAIQMAARAPVLSERAASASDAPARETAQQRLGREVASSAHGNCLKGEYAGGGMGLLSLPFWLAAEASGRCRK